MGVKSRSGIDLARHTRLTNCCDPPPRSDELRVITSRRPADRVAVDKGLATRSGLAIAARPVRAMALTVVAALRAPCSEARVAATPVRGGHRANLEHAWNTGTRLLGSEWE
jgi:hypothetical protein